MKCIYKNITYLIILLMLLQIIYTPIRVEALTDPVKNPNAYNPTPPGQNSYNDLFNGVGNVLGMLQNIGIVVSVISIMILGIKYMIGSVDEKAEYKKTMFPIVIGIILITSIITIINIINDATNFVLKN